MDWLAALCLSVPIAVALIVVASMAADAFTEWRVHHAPAARGAHGDVIAGIAETVAASIRALADAHVTAAKWTAGAKKAKPKPERSGPPTAYERWEAKDGRTFPESVREQVFWACSKLRGEESDEQGDEDDAERILAHYAVGLAEAVRDEFRAELAKKR